MAAGPPADIVKASIVSQSEDDTMQIKDGAQVFTADGSVVGRIDRVVLDPRTEEVTHLVVRHGFLFKEDKVVPIESVDIANNDRVTLNPGIIDLDSLPPFEETQFVQRDMRDTPGMVQPLYGYAPYGNTATPAYSGWIPTIPYSDETVVERVEQNIPENTAGMNSGARVISQDDRHVGEVESLFVDPNSKLATHFVISQGILFKNRKIVPSNWVKTLTDSEVVLGVDANTLERLPDYKGN